MRLTRSVIAAVSIVAVVAGCAVSGSSGAGSCAAPEVSAPSTAKAGETVEFTAHHLFVECNDTGQSDFTPQPLTGLEPKVVVDGVDHVFDYAESLDADADANGEFSAQVQIPEDLSPGAKVEVGVAHDGARYLSAPITIVAK